MFSIIIPCRKLLKSNTRNAKQSEDRIFKNPMSLKTFCFRLFFFPLFDPPLDGFLGYDDVFGVFGYGPTHSFDKKTQSSGPIPTLPALGQNSKKWYEKNAEISKLIFSAPHAPKP